MIYPIVAYGDQSLRKANKVLEKDEVDVKQLAEDLYETMYQAAGVGLAAPQVGINVRVFVVDGTKMFDEEDEEDELGQSLKGFKKVFVNPVILDQKGGLWPFEEGCLSIPGLRADIKRQRKVKIKYLDANWEEHEEEFEGTAARIIQHEYDHLEGKLFTDHLPSLKKQLIKKKLTDISKGIVDVEYKMKFPLKR